MIEHWLVRLRGGAWDGTEITVEEASFPSPEDGPPQHLYMYKCKKQCVGHMQFDLSRCPIHTVVVYNREGCSPKSRVVRYVYGDVEPDAEIEQEHELVGAGVGWGDQDDEVLSWESERLGGAD